MSLLAFLLIGLIAGWLASKIMKVSGYGLAGDLILGVVGAMVGGFVFGLLGIFAFGFIGAVVSATAGAVLLVWLVRQLER